MLKGWVMQGTLRDDIDVFFYEASLVTFFVGAVRGTIAAL